MSYASYVIAAYAVFATVLLWDFVAPRIRIAQVMRAVRLLARREAARGATATAAPELKR
jgi:heme exporter protein D